MTVQLAAEKLLSTLFMLLFTEQSLDNYRSSLEPGQLNPDDQILQYVVRLKATTIPLLITNDQNLILKAKVSRIKVKTPDEFKTDGFQ